MNAPKNRVAAYLPGDEQRADLLAVSDPDLYAAVYLAGVRSESAAAVTAEANHAAAERENASLRTELAAVKRRLKVSQDDERRAWQAEFAAVETLKDRDERIAGLEHALRAADRELGLERNVAETVASLRISTRAAVVVYGGVYLLGVLSGWWLR